jgi:A/G-specific adenine glycosylase
VTEVLLRQTAAWKVDEIFETFFRKFPDPRALGEARISSVRDSVRRIGLQNQRAPQLRGLARALIARCGSLVPRDPSQMQELPGVGPYAAAATACFAFGTPHAIVDTNVTRVARRYWGLEDHALRLEGNRWVAQNAARLLPAKNFREYNLGLLDLAAAVCRHDTPKCRSCPLRRRCAYSISRDAQTNPGIRS